MSTYSKNTNLVELLMYNSLSSHPSFCRLIDYTLSFDKITIKIPNGISSPIPSSDRFDEYMQVLLMGVLTLDLNNITYGDVKIENMIELDGQYKIIDLNLCHFRRVVPFRVCQTYGDDQHLLYLENYEVESYDTQRELVWSLGYIIHSIVNGNKLVTTSEYNEFVRKPYIDDKIPERWKDFVQKAFLPYDKRPQSVREIIKYSPVNIKVISEIKLINSNNKTEIGWIDEYLSDFENGLNSPRELISLALQISQDNFSMYSRIRKVESEEEKIEYAVLSYWYASSFIEEESLRSILFHVDYINPSGDFLMKARSYINIINFIPKCIV